MKILIAPHDDDAELFAAFTCLREKPVVIVCTDSYTQEARGFPVTAEQRHAETRKAMRHLGIPGRDVMFLGVPDVLACRADGSGDLQHDVTQRLCNLDRSPRWARISQRDDVLPRFDLLPIAQVWAPAYALDGHKHHNAIAVAAGVVFGVRIVRRYLTYTDKGKQTNGELVKVEDPDWIRRKLLALSCHVSQFNLDPRMGCWPHFLRSQEEYYEC